MKIIKSDKKGLPIKVDDEDFARLSRYTWSVNFKDNIRYAYRAVHMKYKGGWHTRTFMMHTDLMPGHKYIDHVNRNGLDNQKKNLRSCSMSENMSNSKKRTTGKMGPVTSKFKGVCLPAGGPRWKSSICKDRRCIHLGFFEDEKQAAEAYDRKAIELWGDFALTNKKRGLL